MRCHAFSTWEKGLSWQKNGSCPANDARHSFPSEKFCQTSLHGVWKASGSDAILMLPCSHGVMIASHTLVLFCSISYFIYMKPKSDWFSDTIKVCTSTPQFSSTKVAWLPQENSTAQNVSEKSAFSKHDELSLECLALCTVESPRTSWSLDWFQTKRIHIFHKKAHTTLSDTSTHHVVRPWQLPSMLLDPAFQSRSNPGCFMMNFASSFDVESRCLALSCALEIHAIW